MVSLWVVISACASGTSGTADQREPIEEQPPVAEQAQQAPMDVASSCPMMVEGTSISVADVPDGVAMVFTTTGDVDDLRARVERLAEMHHWHQGKMPMPMAQARVEDVNGGAQMIFQPSEPGQMELLRQHVRRSATQMESGECPMSEMARARTE